MQQSQADVRLARARLSLDGLSVGDGFGQCYFHAKNVIRLQKREIPNPPWYWTDDSNMAFSIYESLRVHGEIRQNELAQSFAHRYHPHRGYGPAMHGLLGRIRNREDWRTAARSLFSGQGSFGNGAPMRVAPLGAYFADDLETAAEQARLSAEITHAHAEASAGAIAVAVGAACAWQAQQSGQRPSRQELIDRVIPYVPDSIVREKLRHARELAPDSSLMLAVSALGNGSQITSQDTVPFVLWCVGENLDDYKQAVWQCVLAGGDIDTTAAMVGGIVAMYTGSVPEDWLAKREPLPDWPFGD